VTARNVLLIDLPSILVPIFHMSASEPDPNATSTQTVARVRGLASGQPHVAIALDAPPYLRKQIDPSYKANRPESIAPLQHQMDLAAEILAGDGFPVWRAKGHEADDILSSATWQALAAGDDVTVMLVSADKDALQLIGPRVTAKSLKDGSIIDADAVEFKFGVRPHQVADYLALVGDTSDNIKGAKGIGGITAAKLLKQFGNLDDLLKAVVDGASDLTPAMRANLVEFGPRLPVVRALIALRTDVPLPFADIWRPRVPADVAVFGDDLEAGIAADIEETMPSLQQAVEIIKEADPANPHAVRAEQLIDEARGQAHQARQAAPQAANGTPAAPEPVPAPKPLTGPAIGPPGALPVPAHTSGYLQVLPAAPVDYERQLEPRNMSEAKQLAQDMFAARLFSAWGNAPAVLAIILSGRELGMAAMQSLRAFDNIDGKPTMKADLIRALVMRSGKAEYFSCTKRTADEATFVTKRKGDPEPIALTYTLEEGRIAWQKSDQAWKASGWGRNSADMCVARAGAKLARLVFPDVVHGLISGEEME
jgi:5'-3' exonuclease